MNTDTEHCSCRSCLRHNEVMINDFPIEMSMMILCPICGNKRCPHATDHHNPCTNSNAPGQLGSSY